MNTPIDLVYWSGLLTTLLLQSACVVLAATVIVRFIRSPQWRRTVWRVCVVSLVLLAFGELTGAGRGMAEWAAARISAPAVESVAAAREDRGGSGVAEARSGDPEVGARVVEALPEDASGKVFWPAIVWLAGSGLVLARLAFAHLLCLKIRLMNRKAPVAAVEDVASIARAMGIRRRICVLDSSGLTGPIAFGLLRPCVVLPEDFQNAFTAEQRKAMLAHELAHLAGRDPLWHLFADVAAALLWWNPFVWGARHCLRVASEHSADEASAVVPNGPEALAESLVLLGGRMSRTESVVGLGVRGGGGFRSNLGRRVSWLLSEGNVQWKRVGARRRLAAGFASGVSVLAIAFGAGFVIAADADYDPKSLGESIRSSWNKSASAMTLAASMERSGTGGTMPERGSPEIPGELPGDSFGEGPAEMLPGDAADRIQVEVETSYLEVPGSELEYIFAWLWSMGTELETDEIGTELIEHSAGLPEGAENEFSRQLTGITNADIRRWHRDGPVGSDLLSSPRVTVLSGERAVIQVAQEDPQGVMAGVVTDVTPTFDEGSDVIRLTLTATVQGHVVEEPAPQSRWRLPWRRGNPGTEAIDEEPQYRVRQVRLEDFAVPAGQTVVLHGSREGVSEEGRALFVFITTKVVEGAPSAEAGHRVEEVFGQ